MINMSSFQKSTREFLHGLNFSDDIVFKSLWQDLHIKRIDLWNGDRTTYNISISHLGYEIFRERVWFYFFLSSMTDVILRIGF